MAKAYPEPSYYLQSMRRQGACAPRVKFVDLMALRKPAVPDVGPMIVKPVDDKPAVRMLDID